MFVKCRNYLEVDKFPIRLILLPHRSARLFQLSCSLRYLLIICLFFSVSALTVFQSWFLRDVNVIFLADMVLFIIPSFFLC